MQELLFELMESEADVLYYIRNAEKPAIIITSGPVGHFPKQRGDKYTLWFGYGIERWSFKTLKQAEEKALAILRSAKVKEPMLVRIVYQSASGKRRYKQILVGEVES